jgi:hypothetical protein
MECAPPKRARSFRRADFRFRPGGDRQPGVQPRGGGTNRWRSGHSILGYTFDTLSAVLLSLISFLLAVVARYSVNYLSGDPAQGRFTKWLCLTGGSVLIIVISGNLVQFALAWSATSWCLHQLLVFYPERPGALLAARKKFIISRLGDLCLLAVVLLVFDQFHTWDFSGTVRQGKAAARIRRCGRRAGDQRDLLPAGGRSDVEIRPVPISQLAAGHDGDAHAGIRADARGHHQRRRLSHHPAESARDAITGGHVHAGAVWRVHRVICLARHADAREREAVAGVFHRRPDGFHDARMRPRCVWPRGAASRRALALQSARVPSLRQHLEPGKIRVDAGGETKRASAHPGRRVRDGRRTGARRRVRFSRRGLPTRAGIAGPGWHAGHGAGLRAMEFVESGVQPPVRG